MESEVPIRTKADTAVELEGLYLEMQKVFESLRQGQFVIVLDNEDRENEGDLIMAASCITPEAVNFMATCARGLICVAITPKRAAELQLAPMVSRNECPHGTAFTVSVDGDAQYGITTGISAYDRAKTIELLVNGQSSDFRRPGHIFPLIAKPGGVLERQGHTEAAVDLTYMAGLPPVGVIVEIMNDDGTMSRRPHLESFATRYNMCITTIEKLCRYRELSKYNYDTADIADKVVLRHG